MRSVEGREPRGDEGRREIERLRCEGEGGKDKTRREVQREKLIGRNTAWCRREGWRQREAVSGMGRGDN